MQPASLTPGHLQFQPLHTASYLMPLTAAPNMATAGVTSTLGPSASVLQDRLRSHHVASTSYAGPYTGPLASSLHAPAPVAPFGPMQKHGGGAPPWPGIAAPQPPPLPPQRPAPAPPVPPLSAASSGAVPPNPQLLATQASLQHQSHQPHIHAHHQHPPYHSQQQQPPYQQQQPPYQQQQPLYQQQQPTASAAMASTFWQAHTDAAAAATRRLPDDVIADFHRRLEANRAAVALEKERVRCTERDLQEATAVLRRAEQLPKLQAAVWSYLDENDVICGPYSLLQLTAILKGAPQTHVESSETGESLPFVDAIAATPLRSCVLERNALRERLATAEAAVWRLLEEGRALCLEVQAAEFGALVEQLAAKRWLPAGAGATAATAAAARMEGGLSPAAVRSHLIEGGLAPDAPLVPAALAGMPPPVAAAAAGGAVMPATEVVAEWEGAAHEATARRVASMAAAAAAAAAATAAGVEVDGAAAAARPTLQGLRPPARDARVWSYISGGRPTGPFSFNELSSWLEAGQIHPYTLLAAKQRLARRSAAGDGGDAEGAGDSTPRWILMAEVVWLYGPTAAAGMAVPPSQPPPRMASPPDPIFALGGVKPPQPQLQHKHLPSQVPPPSHLPAPVPLAMAAAGVAAGVSGGGAIAAAPVLQPPALGPRPMVSAHAMLGRVPGGAVPPLPVGMPMAPLPTLMNHGSGPRPMVSAIAPAAKLGMSGGVPGGLPPRLMRNGSSVAAAPLGVVEEALSGRARMSGSGNKLPLPPPPPLPLHHQQHGLNQQQPHPHNCTAKHGKVKSKPPNRSVSPQPVHIAGQEKSSWLPPPPPWMPLQHQEQQQQVEPCSAARPSASQPLPPPSQQQQSKDRFAVSLGSASQLQQVAVAPPPPPATPVAASMAATTPDSTVAAAARAASPTPPVPAFAKPPPPADHPPPPRPLPADVSLAVVAQSTRMTKLQFLQYMRPHLAKLLGSMVEDAYCDYRLKQLERQEAEGHNEEAETAAAACDKQQQEAAQAQEKKVADGRPRSGSVAEMPPVPEPEPGLEAEAPPPPQQQAKAEVVVAALECEEAGEELRSGDGGDSALVLDGGGQVLVPGSAAVAGADLGARGSVPGEPEAAVVSTVPEVETRCGEEMRAEAAQELLEAGTAAQERAGRDDGLGRGSGAASGMSPQLAEPAVAEHQVVVERAALDVAVREERAAADAADVKPPPPEEEALIRPLQQAPEAKEEGTQAGAVGVMDTAATARPKLQQPSAEPSPPPHQLQDWKEQHPQARAGPAQRGEPRSRSRMQSPTKRTKLAAGGGAAAVSTAPYDAAAAADTRPTPTSPPRRSGRLSTTATTLSGAAGAGSAVAAAPAAVAAASAAVVQVADPAVSARAESPAPAPVHSPETISIVHDMLDEILMLALFTIEAQSFLAPARATRRRRQAAPPPAAVSPTAAAGGGGAGGGKSQREVPTVAEDAAAAGHAVKRQRISGAAAAKARRPSDGGAAADAGTLSGSAAAAGSGSGRRRVKGRELSGLRMAPTSESEGEGGPVAGGDGHGPDANERALGGEAGQRRRREKQQRRRPAAKRARRDKSASGGGGDNNGGDGASPGDGDDAADADSHREVEAAAEGCGRVGGGGDGNFRPVGSSGDGPTRSAGVAAAAASAPATTESSGDGGDGEGGDTAAEGEAAVATAAAAPVEPPLTSPRPRAARHRGISAKELRALTDGSGVAVDPLDGRARRTRAAAAAAAVSADVTMVAKLLASMCDGAGGDDVGEAGAAKAEAPAALPSPLPPPPHGGRSTHRREREPRAPYSPSRGSSEAVEVDGGASGCEADGAGADGFADSPFRHGSAGGSGGGRRGSGGLQARSHRSLDRLAAEAELASFQVAAAAGRTSRRGSDSGRRPPSRTSSCTQEQLEGCHSALFPGEPLGKAVRHDSLTMLLEASLMAFGGGAAAAVAPAVTPPDATGGADSGDDGDSGGGTALVELHGARSVAADEAAAMTAMEEGDEPFGGGEPVVPRHARGPRSARRRCGGSGGALAVVLEGEQSRPWSPPPPLPPMVPLAVRATAAPLHPLLRMLERPQLPLPLPRLQRLQHQLTAPGENEEQLGLPEELQPQPTLNPAVYPLVLQPLNPQTTLQLTTARCTQQRPLQPPLHMLQPAPLQLLRPELHTNLLKPQLQLLQPLEPPSSSSPIAPPQQQQAQHEYEALLLAPMQLQQEEAELHVGLPAMKQEDEADDDQLWQLQSSLHPTPQRTPPQPHPRPPSQQQQQRPDPLVLQHVRHFQQLLLAYQQQQLLQSQQLRQQQQQLQPRLSAAEVKSQRDRRRPPPGGGSTDGCGAEAAATAAEAATGVEQVAHDDEVPGRPWGEGSGRLRRRVNGTVTPPAAEPPPLPQPAVAAAGTSRRHGVGVSSSSNRGPSPLHVGGDEAAAASGTANGGSGRQRAPTPVSGSERSAASEHQPQPHQQNSSVRLQQQQRRSEALRQLKQDAGCSRGLPLPALLALAPSRNDLAAPPAAISAVAGGGGSGARAGARPRAGASCGTSAAPVDGGGTAAAAQPPHPHPRPRAAASEHRFLTMAAGGAGGAGGGAGGGGGAAGCSSEQQQQVELTKWRLMAGRAKKLKFGRSRIAGWGLFAVEPIEPSEFVIEYCGELIRKPLDDVRQRQYDAAGHADYMFAVDDGWVVDATLTGNAARFINHCCDPNCVARIVEVGGSKHIAIYSLRRIEPGEELHYDYKLSNVPGAERIPCGCGARNCKGFMN